MSATTGPYCERATPPRRAGRRPLARMALDALPRLLSGAMRVHIVDPSAYTPPYDHALSAALAAAGADVELFTSRFAYGPVPAPQGYLRHEFFYRSARAWTGRAAGARRAAARS